MRLPGSRIRQRTLTMLLAAVIALFGAGLGTTEGQERGKPVDITYAVQPFFSVGAYSYALEKGIVRPEGINLTVKKMWADQSSQMMMTGLLDVNGIALADVLVAVERGLPLRIIGTDTRIKDAANGLFTLAASGLKTPRELVGKKIGVNDLRQTTIYYRGILKHVFGLPVETITWIPKPLPQLTLLLDQGSIDAAVLWGDFHYKVENDPKYTNVFNLGREWRKLTGHWPILTVMVMQEKILNSTPWAARSMLEALKKSRDHGLANLDQIAQAWVAEKGGSVAELRRQALDIYQTYVITPEDVSDLRTYIQWAVEHGTIKKKIDIETIVFKGD